MKRSIQAAKYQEYNANNRGNNSPDCVKRGISIAFNISYNEVSKLLINKAKEKHKSAWNILSVFEPVIYELGGEHAKLVTEDYTVSEFIDAFFPSGVVIMLVGKHPGQSTHLTCAIDGVLYDSWDSSNQYVYLYYEVKGVTHEFTNIQEEIDSLKEEGNELIQSLYEKYAAKYNLSGEFQLERAYRNQFSLQFNYFYKDEVTQGKSLNEIHCVFTPTMTIEEARKKMIETIKIRMYDRFYAINKAHSEKHEGDDLFYASGYTGEDRKEIYAWGREKQFFQSLPGWIKPFVVYLDVQSPGRYSDSYSVKILPIKGDPRKPEGKPQRNDLIEFYGWDSATVKAQMKRYKQNFERPDEDYSVYEEY